MATTVMEPKDVLTETDWQEIYAVMGRVALSIRMINNHPSPLAPLTEDEDVEIAVRMCQLLDELNEKETKTGISNAEWRDARAIERFIDYVRGGDTPDNVIPLPLPSQYDRDLATWPDPDEPEERLLCAIFGPYPAEEPETNGTEPGSDR